MSPIRTKQDLENLNDAIPTFKKNVKISVKQYISLFCKSHPNFAYSKLMLHNRSHGYSQRKKINIIASHVHGVTGDFFVQVANG